MRNLKKEAEKLAMPMTGISALLVIFAVLCLTVLAILSVSTVKADQKLAERSAAQVEQYYAADCEAEAILARLRQGEIPQEVTPAGETESGDTIYAYTCPLSDIQRLEVQVAAGSETWTILRWQMVSSTDWQADEDLQVWDGA